MGRSRKSVWIDSAIHHDLKTLSNELTRLKGKYVSVEEIADKAIKKHIEEENKKNGINQ